MENSTAYNRRLNLTIKIFDVDKSINNNDLVYMDGRSLKLVPCETTDISKTQKPLRKKLYQLLNKSGRTSLAKRSIEERSITYQTVKSLESKISKPRTRQTLLNNIPQKIFTPMESLPSLVRNDMEAKGMTEIPSDMNYLCCVATGKATGTHSLPLIKYLATQCMEIDFNSSFETLEDEFKECTGTILSEHNHEQLQNTINCITDLNILRRIWNQQNALNWNAITIPPETQPCLDNPPENLLLDQQLPIDTEAEAEPKTNVDTSTKEPTKRKGKRNKKQTAHASTVTLSSDPSTSSASQGARPKEATSSASQGARPKEATSSASQGARPKEATTTSSEPTQNSENGINIENQTALNALFLECCTEVRNGFKEREADVENFITHPTDSELCQKAVNALSHGPWLPGRLYDLLTKAYVEIGDQYFLDQRNMLRQYQSFSEGHAPYDATNNLGYMDCYKRNLADINYPPIHYALIEGATPTKALDSCCTDFSIVDTGIVVELIIAKTLRRFWGDKIYNKYFTKNRFQLISFGSSCKNPYTQFLGESSSKTFTEIYYTKGHVYPFLNHKDYIYRDYHAEYTRLFAFCTDAKTPLFCIPELFENASIPMINEKMAELFNKEPHNEKLMTEESWNIFIQSFTRYFPLDTLNIPTKISAKTISDMQSTQINQYSYNLNFKTTRDIKNEYKRKIGWGNNKEAYPEKFKEDVSLNTEKAISFTDSLSQKNILSTHKSHATRAIRQFSKGAATQEQVLEEFSQFETLLLRLKNDNPPLYTTNEPSYKKMKGDVDRIISTNAH